MRTFLLRLKRTLSLLFYSSNTGHCKVRRSFVPCIYMSKTAVITGVTGQDGSHLADFLLEKGYAVIGLTRRTSTEPPSRMRKHLWDKVIQFSGDVTDSYSVE